MTWRCIFVVTPETASWRATSAGNSSPGFLTWNVMPPSTPGSNLTAAPCAGRHSAAPSTSGYTSSRTPATGRTSVRRAGSVSRRRQAWRPIDEVIRARSRTAVPSASDPSDATTRCGTTASFTAATAHLHAPSVTRRSSVSRCWLGTVRYTPVWRNITARCVVKTSVIRPFSRSTWHVCTTTILRPTGTLLVPRPLHSLVHSLCLSWSLLDHWSYACFCFSSSLMEVYWTFIFA